MSKSDACAGVQLKEGKHGRQRAVAANPGLRYELPWDRYIQLAACARALQDACGANAPLKVLDVGGTDGALALFLPHCTVDVVAFDTTSGAELLATAPGRRSGQSESTYDAVISTDVLEHIEPRARGIFIAQLSMLSHRLCVLNYALPISSTAQKVVATLTEDSRVLDHVNRGLPYSSTVQRQFEETGFICSTRQHTSRALWATFMALQHSSPEYARAIGRYLIEEQELATPNDPLYETFVAQKEGATRESS
jgi:hypothetical protein